MKLSEYLLYRDIEELNKLAEQYQCDCNPHSKLELVQSIHHRMMSHVEFGRQVQQLEQSPELLYYYTLLLFDPKTTYTLDELLTKGKEVEAHFKRKPSGRKWLRQCLQRGWLFPVVNKGQSFFVIPEDLADHLYPRWIKYWRTKLSQISESATPVSFQQNEFLSIGFVVIDEQDALVRDTLRFLQEVAAKGALPLTLSGGLYKKDQQALFRTFLVSENVLKDERWRFGYGRRFPQYPNRFSLLYDFCYNRRWIVEEGQFLYVSSEGERAIHDLGRNDDRFVALHQELVRFWLQTYAKPIRTLAFCLRFLLNLCEEWTDQHSLYQLCSPWISEYYYDSPQTVFEQRICQMMVHLGLLIKASTKDGKTFIKRNSGIIVESFMRPKEGNI